MRPPKVISRASLIARRCKSSSSAESGPTLVTGPSEKTTTWERGARLVKNIKIENEYVDRVREIHDPALHLKTIEDEIKGTIGQALGKQGQKVNSFLTAMEQERQHYVTLLESHEPSADVVLQSAQKHNSYRKDCVKARWELMVHRQAAGFLVGNHKYVEEMFPIGPALPEEGEPHDQSVASEQKSSEEGKQQNLTGQLDWWQRVGRWR